MKRNAYPNENQARRSGVAAAEFAVCLPLLMILFIGTIEACTMIYLKQTLSVAAYEGIRTALQTAATDADVTAAANNILASRNVQGGTVTVSPGPVESQSVQTWLTVTVQAPAASNSVISSFYSSQIISASATMMKEY